MPLRVGGRLAGSDRQKKQTVDKMALVEDKEAIAKAESTMTTDGSRPVAPQPPTVPVTHDQQSVEMRPSVAKQEVRRRRAASRAASWRPIPWGWGRVCSRARTSALASFRMARRPDHRPQRLGCSTTSE